MMPSIAPFVEAITRDGNLPSATLQVVEKQLQEIHILPVDLVPVEIAPVADLN
ncbi:hypothetical protein ACFLXB_03115 [Chloroflexota bacterium]